MWQGRSSKQETDQLMEVDDLSKLKEEPHHLSSAYIRSLVKQLTSSRTKDTMNPKDLLDCGTKFREGFSETQNTHQPQQPQQHKKQVRRRLHTSRPYQERLLNMAEARREIVTALKFHRAAMKQASEQQQPHQEQQPRSQQLLPQSHPCSEPEVRIKSRRNPRIYPSNSTNYIQTMPYSSNFPYQYPSVPDQFSWSSATRIPPPPVYENFDFTALPSQTLGLNLNLQDFNNINTALYHNSNSPPFSSTSGSVSFSASTSSPSSSSPCLSIATDHEHLGSSAAISQMEMEPPAVADTDDSGITTSGGDGLHAAMDDEEMAEIRSIGEQHQMEWNDTMNLVTSAWWLKFLKAEEDDDGYHLPFDEVLEFPSWLNATEGSFQQHLNDYYSADYFEDPALPCMDIGEFEGFDGEWLA